MGGGQSLIPGSSLIQEDYLDSTTSSDPTASPAPLRPYFRGCLGEIRLQDILLPSFSPEFLANDTALNKFDMIVS